MHGAQTADGAKSRMLLQSHLEGEIENSADLKSGLEIKDASFIYIQGVGKQKQK